MRGNGKTSTAKSSASGTVLQEMEAHAALPQIVHTDKMAIRPVELDEAADNQLFNMEAPSSTWGWLRETYSLSMDP